MQDNLSKFETIKLATQYWQGDPTTTLLIVIIVILSLALIVIGGMLLQKKFQSKNLKTYFETIAKERGLTDEEIKILWKYAQKLERDPLLVLEFKAPFERVVDYYIHNDPNADEELVRDMRKKLGFDTQSPYIPLITTKDIEIFQNAHMVFADKRSINVALYDKDERYMYWLVTDNNFPSNVHRGEKVKVIFIREEDGIYTFIQPIEDIIQEGGKTIIKIPHTFELQRTQRREYPRVRVDLPVVITFESREGPIVWRGHFFDISAGGAKVCIEEDLDKLKLLKYNDELILSFTLNQEHLAITAKVLDKEIKAKKGCIRLLFEDIDEKIKDKIVDFVQKEQLKLAQLNQL